jgi:RNA polymerase sigma factor (sigma-70 family)
MRRMKPGYRQGKLSLLDQEIGSGAERLSQYVHEQATSLQGIICSYVVRSGLAQGEAAWATAAEVLSDTMLEALAHAERLDSSIQPQAWLLGIAANMLKRRKASLMKQRREVLVSDLHRDSSSVSAAAFFDQIATLTSPGPEHALEDQERVQEILALVSPQDQEVLRLAILYDLDTQSLARALGVSPGAARVRLHRALNRLRLAWSGAPGVRKRGEARE